MTEKGLDGIRAMMASISSSMESIEMRLRQIEIHVSNITGKVRADEEPRSRLKDSGSRMHYSSQEPGAGHHN